VPGHPRPEVLAPAGAPDCLPAAVAGGADAVYLGLRHFNARGRAENFRLADLPGQVRYLHAHGVKCYVVLNTLLHDDELPKALHLAAHAAAAGVDAAIIQDLGLWQALTRTVPDLARHASTQMTVHHPSQIDVLADLGAQRVILARELAAPEIAACAEAAARRGIEVEHFVHGALCYAFSGQCLMSNFAGCRSANRGTCAQNCRFVYRTDDGAEDTTLSMRDLRLVGRVADLARAGVASLKIEGRLKGPDYVYTVSRLYRAAVDSLAGGAFDLTRARDLLQDVFARPQTETPLDGDYGESARLHRADPLSDLPPDARLVSFDRAGASVVVRMAPGARPPDAGQGYRYAIGMATGGFLVLAVQRQGDQHRLRVRCAPHGPYVPAGTPLFRNADHARRSEAATAMATVPVVDPGIAIDLTVHGSPGEALAVTARTADGRSAALVSAEPLQAATGRPLTTQTLADTLGAVGGTGLRLGALNAHLAGPCFLPARSLKELRRALIGRLGPPPAVPEPVWTIPVGQARRRATAVWVAVADAAAGRAALAAGAAAVWLENHDPAPDDGRWWRRQAATAPLADSGGLPVVAGHLGQLAAARREGRPAIADVFLNTCSAATLDLLARLGATAAVISLECSAREVARLCDRAGAVPALALVAGGRVPAMLTRQDHALAVGARRTITASAAEGGLPYILERRQHDTVVWEARRLCAPAEVQRTAGLVDAWVVEAGDLDPEAVARLTAAYVALAAGGNPAAVREAHAASAPHGIFAGHLEIGSRALDAVAAGLDADALA
jgi:U32 family peptidase